MMPKSWSDLRNRATLLPVLAVILVLVISISILAYFTGWIGPSDHELAMMGANVTRGILADDPRWPKLEKQLDHCNDHLKETGA